jgi:inward rectifier potassium channel
MRLSSRRLKMDLGGIPAYKSGAPSAISDMYYWMMEMNWLQFIGAVTLFFILINLLFGVIYSRLPGAVLNLPAGSIVDGFFFSIETLATVGYGNMAPVTHLGHALAAIEILLGLFFTATVTGLIFARFSRPRDTFVFSRAAVIGSFQGKRALMIRLATTRSRALADVTAQVAWLERVVPMDDKPFRRLVELPLVRSRNPMLGLSWTLVHVIEPDSAFYAALRGEDRFLVAVTVSGMDMLLASQSHGSISYKREDILLDHEFADIISELDGAIHLDLSKLHDAVPVTNR